jgi:hypothetical protein
VVCDEVWLVMVDDGVVDGDDDAAAVAKLKPLTGIAYIIADVELRVIVVVASSGLPSSAR